MKNSPSADPVKLLNALHIPMTSLLFILLMVRKI